MSQTFGIAVKALIQNPNEQFLILFKSESEDVWPQDFDIPGGRVQRGEKLEDVIVREVREECWLAVEVERVSRTWWFTKEDLHLVGITFLVKCGEIREIKLSDEHTNYFWKSKEEILEGEFPKWLKEEVFVI